MKVLAIQPFLRGYTINPFAGGRNKAALRLTQYLVAHGHEVFVLPWLERTLGTTLFYLSDKLYATAVPSMRFSLSEEFTALPRFRFALRFLFRPQKQLEELEAHFRELALQHAMETLKPDIVHVNHTRSNFPYVYRKLGRSVPLILTHTHGTGAYLSHYDTIVFFSHFVRDRVYRERPSEVRRSRVIYGSVDPEYYTPTIPKLSDETVFLGTLRQKRKGLDILLDAYATDRALNRWRLTVIGEGPLRAKYEQMAALQKLNVRFVGRLPNKDVARLMSESSLFVLPSREESFGIVYAEALCMGLPIIGYSPSVEEFGQHLGLKVGLPFDASTSDPRQLAELIKQMMSPDSGFDEAYRNQLLHRARQAFSLEKFGSEYVACYEETIAAKGF